MRFNFEEKLKYLMDYRLDFESPSKHIEDFFANTFSPSLIQNEQKG